MVISRPLRKLAEVAIDGMIRAIAAPSAGGNSTSILPFDLHTREIIQGMSILVGNLPCTRSLRPV